MHEIASHDVHFAMQGTPGLSMRILRNEQIQVDFVRGTLL
jgi:hypothetical protein